MGGENKDSLLLRLKAGKRLGKEQFVIFILVGILLIIIALPTETSKKSEGAAGLWNMSGAKSNADKIEDTQITKEKAGEIPMEAGEYENWEAGNEDAESYEKYLENKLEQIISVMEGAGKAKVIVTVSASKEKVVEKDIPETRSSTQEKDAQGGSRIMQEDSFQEETVYVEESGVGNVPYVVKTLQPVIEGVVVVVQGGDKLEVRKNISEAIVALFGIESHKIKIIKMQSE
ncbi:hypothetical protein [Kineothrix sp. MB12-C1]|uniref:hypothetical protein n=1 Tax=Kineothrix sp. MB12-C1 TaxID=3070215 RepID=UPI0027D2657E|nr:hypothetical protein [Kineothrix sp. MB12-C1]WMC92944.1 hypothetical protein RBB56_01245 [Kineothrix sp. MB12-C1]